MIKPYVVETQQGGKYMCFHDNREGEPRLRDFERFFMSGTRLYRFIEHNTDKPIQVMSWS